MTDQLQSAQPLAARLMLTLTRQLARRTDTTAIGVQPQADQQPRVGVLASRVSFHCGNLLMIATQIQPPHQLPDRSHAMVFVDKLLDIHASQYKLLPINRNQS